MKKISLLCALNLVYLMAGPVALAHATPSPKNPMPTQVGTCVLTRISSIGNRLQNTPGSGSAASFSNGGFLVDYDQKPVIDTSIVGDRVMICMVLLDTSCPSGSGGGSHAITNLRTFETGVLGTSSHQCRGA